MTFRAGTKVGARRWPYAAAHPDCWGAPRQGVVLAEDDPRAWADSLAFPHRTPTADEAQAHVKWCRQRGYLSNRQPVLWDFGDVQQVFWEPSDSLAYMERDFAAWRHERALAYATLHGLRVITA